MKKRMVTLMTLAMSVAVSAAVVSSAWAGVFDDYVDCRNPDGTSSCYFDRKDMVPLDENRNTIVKIRDQGATINLFLASGQSGGLSGIREKEMISINECETIFSESEDMTKEFTESEDVETETDPDANQKLDLKLEPEHLEMLVVLDGEEDDQYEELILTANGRRVPSKKARWESDHPEIVEVDESGWVTSMWIGTATITAYYAGEKLKCTIHVTQKITSDSSIIYEE